ncbi:aldo/keto reductase [Rugosimonospora africana]|uniref:Aldo/keto reductase n=1 Tax=Rugosimonospora africana TaxID=556532 RepID=A0A8J3QWA3_9ACTN|nr:aldo/keto reductase [Rugosimonospora africana]GIH16985.1 aldo/keto reductase [Rugosimonospora africana]
MKYRLLGRTGVWVSELSLGAMTFGGADHPLWGGIGGLGQQDVDRLVGAALDAGVNFVDTANVYADGQSEELLGKALGKRRRDVVLATKVMGVMGPGPNQLGLSRLHMMQELEDSLRRLGTDHIDLYQIHNFDHLTPLDEVLRALDDAVTQGKVRYIGCANLAAWQISRAQGIAALHGLNGFVATQEYYSLVGRDVERDIVPMVEAEGLALTVWSPLAGGFLAGKTDAAGAFTEGRQSDQNLSGFLPTDRKAGAAVLDVLRAVAARHEASPARVALAWLLAQRGVTSVIVGARRLDQLTDNLAASELALTDRDLAELDEVSKPPMAYPNWIQDQFRPARIPG